MYRPSNVPRQCPHTSLFAPEGNIIVIGMSEIVVGVWDNMSMIQIVDINRIRFFSVLDIAITSLYASNSG